MSGRNEYYLVRWFGWWLDQRKLAILRFLLHLASAMKSSSLTVVYDMTYYD